MRRYFITALSALCMLGGPTAQAVPAYPARRTVTLPDGTQVEARLTGDEFLHFYRDADGNAYTHQADGSFRLLAGYELRGMLEDARDLRLENNARRLRTRVGDFQPGGIKGRKKGVVILVAFKDNAFSIGNPHETFNDYFNLRGYDYNGMAGCVGDYFREQSYGQLEVDFDVVGPYQLSRPMAYYGAPTSNGAHDARPQEMVVEACRMANDEVDYADYDWDGDGVVDQVFVIYAGYGENYGADPNTIWPHQYYIPEDLQLDYMRFGSYACTSELLGTRGTTLAGIGTACHEFSHCLGHPDTYDTGGGGNIGMASWDIMCSGSYNNNGYTPAGYTAYERWMSGWLTPVEVTGETHVGDMKPLEEAGEAYVLYNEANRNEFYLLENRQPVHFDAALPGRGMLVTHIDYDKGAWTSNTPNNASGHERITFVPADGAASASGDAGDPFPGKAGVHNLTDYTLPAATLYNANTDGARLLHKAVENIVEAEGGRLSFDLMLPELPVPAPEAAHRDGNLEVVWDAVPEADAYELRCTLIPAQGSMEEALIFEEDFQGAYRATAGFTDIGGSLNSYLKTPGFSGENLFQSPDLLRLGSSQKQGVLQAPTIRQLQSGKFTVEFTLKPFKNGEETTGTLMAVTQSGVQETFSLSFSQETTFVFRSASLYRGMMRLALTTTKRSYISHMAMYDGEFYPEDTRATRAGVQDFTVNVRENRYVMEGADPTATYRLTLRVLKDYRAGRWSETVEVAPQGNAIPLLPQDSPSVLQPWFDLQGRPIARPTTPGLYIHGRRKVLLK